MTGVRKFTPVNRLAKAFNDPTGLLYKQALQRAEENVEKIRPAQIAALDVKLTRLRETAADATVSEENAALFYRLAQDVLADSGSVGFTHISRAAASLCDLLVSKAPEARMRRGVAVHLDALTALRAAGEEAMAPQREAILAGLAKLSAGH